mgnify:CR=1 FL=1
MSWTKVTKGWNSVDGNYMIRKLKNGRFSVFKHKGGQLPWTIIANCKTLEDAKDACGV